MRRLALLLAAALVAAACGATSPDDAPTTTAAETADTSPTAEPNQLSTAGETAIPDALLAVAESWPTNWSNRAIDLSELLVGIPTADPRDRIQPIDAPIYEDVTAADDWLVDNEQGVLFRLDGDALFYPIRILIAHEIVNDQRGDVPFSLTYCPLCNTATAFDRRVDGQVLRFGVSGLLRNSDLVMWDDATVSLWQQNTGEAIVGDFTGTQLEFLSTALVRWADFRDNHPDGEVLSQASGPYNYGTNSYVGYSSRSQPYERFFDPERLDDRFPALSRVVGIRVGDQTKAYPFSTIQAEGVVNDEFAGQPIAVFWGAAETADSLDTSQIGSGAGIGTGIAFIREVDGQMLTFTAAGDDTFTDVETGTRWNLLGLGLEGPLAGTTLTKAIHQNEFWFAWAAFNGGAPVYGLE